ncbi:phosphate-starvation-inducible PsiE family protein [Caenispirillum salinarum]|uniref:phosphate-starvation-inducible PsiE family protein n=1 Tax=Caenispirillum salinarum TaxID=859058 RepID=UPI00384A6CA5
MKGGPIHRAAKGYAAFERIIAWLLLVGMAGVIVLATANFLRAVVETALGYNAGWNYSTFQALFDGILAAVIALELAHSVQQMAEGQKGLVQVRTVILIGVLAVVRKLIVLEIEDTTGAFLTGLGVAVLALGAVYALILWVEGKVAPEPPHAPGEREDE